MNAMTEPLTQEDGTFLHLVDFKWLMAGLGWWVDLSRLQRDTVYADECIQRGLASGSKLLHQRSVELPPLLACLRARGSTTLPCMPTEFAL